MLDIDKENRKMNLSYKLAMGDPWENIEEKYNEGIVVKGTVEKNLRKWGGYNQVRGRSNWIFACF